jgi:hypothetical protein
MRRFVLALGASAATLLIALPALADDNPAAPFKKGERELAKLLERHEAGEPVRCVRTVGVAQPMRTIEGTAYVFGDGPVLYVQRTTRPQDISRRFALSIKRLGTTSGVEICRTDVFETFDRGLGVPRASVIFEDFVPYTKRGQN